MPPLTRDLSCVTISRSITRKRCTPWQLSHFDLVILVQEESEELRRDAIAWSVFDNFYPYFHEVRVEAYHLGQIVGEPTAGTNGGINPFTVPGGLKITWSGMRVRKSDGSRFHGIGVWPTIPVARTIRGVREGRDEVLDRAIEILSRW